MNESTQLVDNKELISNNGNITQVKQALELVTEAHKTVSHIETPKRHIYQLMGLDYVKIGYMREIADRYFPGWSWTIIKSEALGSEAYVVHGRLKWWDNGIWREGDMVAAHRIQKKRESSKDFVNVGNDIKAANTDTLKKAFNMYMNIADDVYRNQIEDLNLTKEEIEEIMRLAIDVGKGTTIAEKLDNGEIHGANKKGVIAKLERLSNDNK
jgi:hypothetical protein